MSEAAPRKNPPNPTHIVDKQLLSTLTELKTAQIQGRNQLFGRCSPPLVLEHRATVSDNAVVLKHSVKSFRREVERNIKQQNSVNMNLPARR